jgi:hypothetical protein
MQAHDDDAAPLAGSSCLPGQGQHSQAAILLIRTLAAGSTVQRQVLPDIPAAQAAALAQSVQLSQLASDAFKPMTVQRRKSARVGHWNTYRDQRWSRLATAPWLPRQFSSGRGAFFLVRDEQTAGT